MSVARYHSLDMAANEFFAHVSPDDRRPHARIQAMDRTLIFDRSRENLAKIQGIDAATDITERLHEGLMDSPSHRENILADDMSHMAMGVPPMRHGPDIWLTQVFVNRSGELAIAAPLRVFPEDVFELEVGLSDWTFSRFVADTGADLVPFVKASRSGPVEVPDLAPGDIVLRVRGERTDLESGEGVHIHFSGPLVTIENRDGLEERRNVAKRFLLQRMFGHHRAFRRIARSENEERFLMPRPLTNLAQKTHWRRCVDKRCKARSVTGGEQKPRRDTDALIDIIVLLLLARTRAAAFLRKDNDQPRGVFKVRFVSVCAQRLERIKPDLACPAIIERALFFLGGFADLAFHLWLRDAGKKPRLMIGP